MTQLPLFDLAEIEPAHASPTSGRLILYHVPDGRTLLIFANGKTLPPTLELYPADRAWLRAALVNPYTDSQQNLIKTGG